MIPYYIKEGDSRTLKNCLNHIGNLSPFKSWEIRIEEAKKKRTLQQNKLYWTYLNIVQKETGHNKYDLHDFFCVDILGMREIKVKGKYVSVPKSTTSLTTKEFTEYINEVQARIGAFGITLPAPSHWGY